jgi:O-antigen biosynthesis protein
MSEGKTDQLRIAINIAARRWERVHLWGDYHLGLGLKKELEAKGHNAVIQTLPEWKTKANDAFDVVVFLRGIEEYQPKKHQLNLLWHVSHPNMVSIKEYEKYDFVFIASNLWARIISQETTVPVESMLQCTDTKIFKTDKRMETQSELLYVGNTRKNTFRKILKDVLPTNRDLAVYGRNWHRFIDKKYIKKSHIPYRELYKYYSSCDVFLYDHWDDMMEKGFISNRIFDALASEAFIISDDVNGIEQVLGDSVVTYHSPEELHDLIDYYLENPQLRTQKSKRGSLIVREQHTFKHRAERFIEVINQLKLQK